jgi:hypothetical protein
VPLVKLNVPEVAEGVPVQVPFVNHAKLTVPVGVPLLPVTLALS